MPKIWISGYKLRNENHFNYQKDLLVNYTNPEGEESPMVCNIKSTCLDFPYYIYT